MKRSLILFFVCLPIYLNAQYVDYWTGKLSVFGQEVTIQFNVTYKDMNPWVISVDIPEQNLWGINCKLAKWTTDSFNIDIPDLASSFISSRAGTDTLAKGKWNQAGFDLELTLNRNLEDLKPDRPQTPEPPFDYIVEKLVIQNTEQNVELYGELTMPKGAQPKACAIMITGSGKQDMDETISGHKPFLVIADFLTKNGYAVLRYDDRGAYRSTGDFSKATIFDMSTDVNAAVDLAMQRTGLTEDKIGLIGHSEGSIVAQSLLKRRPLGFFISMAGPGAPVSDLLYKQNYDLMDMIKVKEDDFKKSVGPFLTKLYKIVGNLKLDSAAAYPKVKKLCLQYKTKLPKTYLSYLFGEDGENLEIFAAAWVEEKLRHFVGFKPSDYLKEIKTPMLAINGELDKQVYSKENLDVFRKFAKNNPLNKTIEFPGKNHLFQNTTTGDISEYGTLTETISTDVMDSMLVWMNGVYK